MARLNLEDKWFDDPRRLALIAKIGAVQTDGSAVQIFRLAQAYFKQNVANGSIPKHIFMTCPNADLFLEIGLATEIGDFIEVRGSKEHFAWLKRRQMAGSKGGTAKASKSKQSLANRSKSKQTLASVSVSVSNKNKEYMSKGETDPEPEKPDGLPDLKALWNENSSPLPTVVKITTHRRSAWAARWKEMPDLAYWVGVIRKLAGNLYNQGNDPRSTGWVCDVDFFLKPDTHVKASEGKYDSKQILANPSYEVKDAL